MEMEEYYSTTSADLNAGWMKLERSSVRQRNYDSFRLVETLQNPGGELGDSEFHSAVGSCSRFRGSAGHSYLLGTGIAPASGLQ